MAEKGSGKAKRLRCAAYTRKSSDEGLAQEFNSLHAQREACESYIASQRHEGWHALAALYDDGGLSGGTMDRPALQRLLGDIGAGKVDVVVVYKIDRLTRSLFDFAKIVEAFDAKGVSFVSVTQQFNTTTSMGRLTLNVLLSFAQFEREVTSERIRDKIAASKQKGMWMGGGVPLGYDALKRKLRVNDEEAKTVRLLFELYLTLGSVRRLQEECQRLGLRTKLRTMLDGRQSGGTAFSRGHLYLILSNPIYIGRIPHRGRSYVGQHEAIIDDETWEKTQAQLAINAGRKRGRTSSKQSNLLAGLLFTAEGVPFTPSHAVNHGKRYRYYAERSLLAEARGTTDKPNQTVSGADGKPNASNGKGWRLPAHQIEQLILKQLAEFLRDHGALLDALGTRQRRSPDQVSILLKHASTLAKLCDAGSPVEQLDVVGALVRRVSIASTQMTIEINRDALAVDILNRDGRSVPEVKRPAMQVQVPIELRRRGVEAKLIVLGGQGSASEPDTNLIKALTRAHDWLGRIVHGEANGPGDIASSERLCRTYVTRFLCLAFLAPDITEDLLEGRQPSELTTKKLIRSALQVPLLWPDQRAFFGFGSAVHPTNVSALD